METLYAVSEEIRALGEEYAKKPTAELPIRAMVSIATYCEKTDADQTLRKLAGILAYVLVVEGVKNKRNCDVELTLNNFSHLVKDMLGELHEDISKTNLTIN